jgi:hypothetical protein
MKTFDYKVSLESKNTDPIKSKENSPNFREF